jgi:hypothetical protein
MPAKNWQRIQNSLHLEELEGLVAFRRVDAVGRFTMFDGLHRTQEAGGPLPSREVAHPRGPLLHLG